MVCTPKKKKYILILFQNITQIEKKVILLMIPNREGEHCYAVKTLSALLRGITSKNDADLCCLNGLHSFRTKHKLESHKRL